MRIFYALYMILYALYFILFIFGLCVGSFLNAVIFRLDPTHALPFLIVKQLQATKLPVLLRGGKGGVWARSHCPHCKTTLQWHDLMPVLSFIFLRGRCRYCDEKISWQYPAVEIITGVLFVLIFNFQFSIFNEFSITQFSIGKVPIFNLSILNWISVCYMLYVACSMVVIFAYDLKHSIIPDKILLPVIFITFLWRSFLSLKIGHWSLIENWSLVIDNFIPYLFSATAASIFFFLIVFISRGRAMGLGDVKLAFFMGLVLGWPNILVALFFSFLSGAIVGLGLIFSGAKNLKSQIPFGPFLVAGTFAALFWGEKIMDWYLKILF